jgi:Ala-tRNA(Pro) deacylase
MKLETLLDQSGISYEKHLHSTTYTAQGLAAEEHVSGYLVAKPVIVMHRNDPVMCVIPAPKHVDLGRVAKLLDVPEVHLATETEMAELFPDCELGAEPPVGKMYNMRTVMDKSIKDDDYLIMQAGTHRDAVKLRREDWERIVEPIEGDITQ